MKAKKQKREAKTAERQKKWEYCDGNCNGCWPKVKARCPKKNSAERFFTDIDLDALETKEDLDNKQADIGEIVTQISRLGFINIIN